MCTRHVTIVQFSVLTNNTGSFGVVYEAFDKERRRCVAMKVYSPDKSTMESSGRTESQVSKEICKYSCAFCCVFKKSPSFSTAMLRSLRPCQYIVEYVTDFVSGSGSRALVMGMIRGCNLHNLVLQSAAKGLLLPIKQTRHIMYSVFEGLAHLKNSGVQHGDIKPGN
jgi:serine/threonine protein kinase